LIRERTQAGLAAAWARGKPGGGLALLDAKKLKLLRILYAEKTNRTADILSTMHISKSTLYRYLKAQTLTP
jgi:DNA invertase Pin-like site-specific DNA recombinase